MPTRTSIGAVTIADIKDGINPLSMVLSNQSHTFAADNSGVTTGPEKDKFMCEVFVFVGDTKAIYESANTSNNTYNVTITDPSGWVTTTAVVNNQLQISLATIPTGTTNVTGLIDLSIDIRNSIGNVTNVTGVISLAKAIEGAGGAIIVMKPNRQTFRFDEFNATVDGSITMTVETQGNTGALTALRSLNGAAFAALNVGAGAGFASAIDIDGSGGNDAITITAANFGTSDTMAIRVEGTDTSDTVSLIKIQDGKTGAASILVTIASDVGGFQFKNNAGAAKTLTASVYDMADGSLISSGLTYQWYVDGVTEVGETSATIGVSASDIPDGGSELYSCNVVLTE
jgi:hypothetical protein